MKTEIKWHRSDGIPKEDTIKCDVENFNGTNWFRLTIDNLSITVFTETTKESLNFAKLLHEKISEAL